MAAQMNNCVILTSEYKVSTNKKQHPEKPLPFYIFCLSLPLLSGRSEVRIPSGVPCRRGLRIVRDDFFKNIAHSLHRSSFQNKGLTTSPCLVDNFGISL